MQRTRFFVAIQLGIVALLVLTLVPAQALAGVQSSSNTYESLFGYTITWSDEWSIDETLSIRSEGTIDLITLWNSNSDFLMISGVTGQVVDPASMLEPGDGDEVISSNLDGEVPQLVTESDGFRSIAEGYSIDDGDVVITVSLTATLPNYERTLAQVQDDVKINGSPILVSAPLADTAGATDLTGISETPQPTSEIARTQRGGAETTEATGEASTGVTRTTRGSTETADPSEEVQPTSEITRTTRGSSETPEPTEDVQPTNEITRTTRGSSETPTPTDVATQVVSSGLDSFVGPVYGYTLEYDSDIWTAGEEHSGDGTDGISLSTATSTLTIWAWDGYGNDPVACLDGEASFYATEVDRVSDWEQVMDADGEPLRDESAEVAWGVYSLTYENNAGNKTALIDYISCQPIPGEDAVLIVLLSAAPENYNDNLDLTFDILDTVQFAEESTQPDPATVEVIPTAEATTGTEDRTEIDTNFDGSLYTSPVYGFTVYVPLEWQIVSETAEGNEEILVLDNGTSVVTLWSTDAPVGDLAGCVDFAADGSGKNLTLLKNSTGGDFRGVYGDEAFGNFVYDAGGVQMMYFIGCRPIPGSDAVLIVIQDVEFSQFTDERKFRNDIESSITMP